MAEKNGKYIVAQAFTLAESNHHFFESGAEFDPTLVGEARLEELMGSVHPNHIGPLVNFVEDEVHVKKAPTKRTTKAAAKKTEAVEGGVTKEEGADDDNNDTVGETKNRTKETDEVYLQDLLDESEAAVLSYTGRPVTNDKLNVWVLALALTKFNREGTEGLTKRSEGGIAEEYEAGIPTHIRIGLDPYRVAFGRRL